MGVCSCVPRAIYILFRSCVCMSPVLLWMLYATAATQLGGGTEFAKGAIIEFIMKYWE